MIFCDIIQGFVFTRNQHLNENIHLCNCSLLVSFITVFIYKVVRRSSFQTNPVNLDSSFMTDLDF